MLKRLPLLMVVVATANTIGCASLSLPFVGNKTRNDVVRATAANPVMEAITIWEPGEGRGLDNLPTRGFAGQVLFFTYKNATPALVDGNVTVYVFDDQGTVQEQSRPLWQHTFSSQEWNALSLQTNLGTAYQLFVPYNRKGLHRAHCSLRIKLEPTDGGPPIYSKMANVTLEGEDAQLAESKLVRRRIEPRRFDAGAEEAMRPLAEASAQERLRTSTLSLPGRPNVSAQAAARLERFAQEMVRNQQDTGGVVQAGYVTETPVEQSAVDEEATPSSRYRLYR